MTNLMKLNIAEDWCFSRKPNTAFDNYGVWPTENIIIKSGNNKRIVR